MTIGRCRPAAVGLDVSSYGNSLYECLAIKRINHGLEK